MCLGVPLVVSPGKAGGDPHGGEAYSEHAPARHGQRAHPMKCNKAELVVDNGYQW